MKPEIRSLLTTITTLLGVTLEDIAEITGQLSFSVKAVSWQLDGDSFLEKQLEILGLKPESIEFEDQDRGIFADAFQADLNNLALRRNEQWAKNASDSTDMTGRHMSTAGFEEKKASRKKPDRDTEREPGNPEFLEQLFNDVGRNLERYDYSEDND